MSNPELLCTSLEVSRQMKEAGFPQGESYFVWAQYATMGGMLMTGKPEWFLCTREEKDNEAWDVIAAPTVGELGEMLPEGIESYRNKAGWHVWAGDECDNKSRHELAPTEADARGKMWLWLKENGYLEGEK